MTTEEILAVCDAKAEGWLPILEDYVTTYRASHPTFWQGLQSHSVIPQDGEEERPDIGTKTPPGRADAPWPPALRTALLPFAAQVDEYVGPLGLGYFVTLRVVIAGETWQRTQQLGPETWWAKPWAAVPRGTPP